MRPGLDRERLLTAYIDGQLSASEAVAFEATLSQEEREWCAREIHFEQAVCEVLAGPIACPEALWQQLSEQMETAPRPRRRWLAQPWVAWSAFGGLAAALAFTFYDVDPAAGQGQFFEPVLSLPADAVSMQSESSTPPDHDAVQQFMRQRDVMLIFNNFAGFQQVDGHEVRLLGASEQGCHGRSVMEILFQCCGMPVKVVLAREDTAGADILEQGVREGRVKFLTHAGTYVMGVVGAHHAPDLTRLFQQPGTRLATI